MTEILRYKGKHENVFWDASTPEKKIAAFRALFELLRDDWEFYHDLQEDLGWDETPSKQRQWFQLAQGGDAVALQRLLNARKDYEYEGWRIEAVIDPLLKKVSKA